MSFRKGLQMVLCLGLVFPGGAARAQEEPFSLTVLYTGGMADRFEQILKVRAVAQRVEKEAGAALLVHVGAALSSAEEVFQSADGEPSLTVSLMNRAGYDAWLPGVDDFSASAGGLSPFLRSAQFAVLGANLYRPGTGRPLLQVQPYTVFPLGRMRVGVLGLGSGGAGANAAPVLDAARYYVPLVRREADLVVALTDQGFSADSTLAASVEGVHVILGAREPGGSPRQVNGVWIAYSEGDGRSVGRLDLTVSEGAVTASGEPISLEKEPEEPRLLAAALEGWTAEVGGKPAPVYTVLGKSGGGFGGSLGQSAAMGHLVADLMRSAARTDLAFAAASSLDPRLPAGNIRVMDVFRVYRRPFRLAVFSLKGRQVRAFLEGGMKAPGGFFYPSGLEVVYDLSRPEGQRVVSLTVGGKPLEDGKTYRVAAEDRIAIPGGTAPGLAEQLNASDRTHTGVLVRDLLARHVKTLDEIQGHVDDRVRER